MFVLCVGGSSGQPFPPSAVASGMDQFGDTILFTTDDEILEAMSCYDETFLSESEGPEGLVHEEELQRPRTADGEGEERPFTQAGFREEDLAVSMGHRARDVDSFVQPSHLQQNSKARAVLCPLLVETPPQPLCEPV